MFEEKVKEEIKEIIKENIGIIHTRILEKIVSSEITSKKTAEKYMKKLVAEREIFVRENGKKREYFLKAQDLNQNELTEHINKQITDLKERLDEIKENLPSYSDDKQKSLYHAFLERRQIEIRDIENSIKRNNEFEKENEKYDHVDLTVHIHKIIELMEELTNEHKLNDCKDHIDHLHKLSDLTSKKIKKISKLKKQKLFGKKIKDDKNISDKNISDEINKIKDGLDLKFETGNVITSLENLKESDKGLSRLDTKTTAFMQIESNLKKIEKEQSNTQRYLSKFKIEGNQQSEDEIFEEINSGVTTIDTSLKSMNKNIEKIRRDRYSDELAKEVHLQMSELYNITKKIKPD